MIKQITAGLGILTLAASANASLISNGSFDDGLNGWGNTNTFWGAGVSVETDGSTGNNYARLDDPSSFGGEALWQSFYVPTGVDSVTVSFDYKFEVIDNSWAFDDKAWAKVLKSDTNTWIDLDVLVHTHDDTNGWITFVGEVNTTSLMDIDPNAKIIFDIWESSSIFGKTDSALYVDNVSIVENYASVPEPSSLMLLGLGLVGFAVSRKRKS